MLSTMQDVPLTLTHVLERGRRHFAGSEVVTWEGSGSRRSDFGMVADRAAQLAAALRRLGVARGDRVGTLCWNNQEHLEAYLAIPCMGAVLHTLNLRLPLEQLAWVINHAEDRVLIVDGSLLLLYRAVAPQLTTVRHVVVTGDVDPSVLDGELLYEQLLSSEPPDHSWPALDEREAAAMCYTTGTTGDPRGVVYSHRSTVLHSLAGWGAFGLREADRILPIVPMFHVMAWGIPYIGWMVGADLLLTDRHLQPGPLVRFIEAERPTYAAGIPLIFTWILDHAATHPTDLSSLRMALCGGSAVPRSLIEAFQERHGVTLIQAWGMTEMSPMGTIAEPPKGVPRDEEMAWRTLAGRVTPLVELRATGEDGSVLPTDGVAVGEIEARGPWVTASYHRDPAEDCFHDGWLRTGDVGSLDPRGFLQIRDRSKDVIKSGGEWISSVELESLLAGHPAVADAAVIAVPDDRWQERPLAAVVLHPDAVEGPAELRAYLAARVSRIWLPERWAMVEVLPKTSVGKQDKKVLRSLYAEGRLPVVECR
ncbi:MAG: long-chain fatty acid--CoA ligase [Candidatus Dormibacteria bacterium]